MNIKNILISAAVIATAAAAAQAQGWGTVRDINDFGKEYLLKKQTQTAMQKVEKEAQKQEIAYLRAQQKKAEQQAAEQAKQQQPKESSAQEAKPAQQAQASQTPSYYYGREGKLLALSDKTAEVLDSQAEPAGKQTAAKPEAKKSTEAKPKKKVSIWRYFLPGPMPGESWSAYNQRMSYAGSQPFK